NTTEDESEDANYLDNIEKNAHKENTWGNFLNLEDIHKTFDVRINGTQRETTTSESLKENVSGQKEGKIGRTCMTQGEITTKENQKEDAMDGSKGDKAGNPRGEATTYNKNENALDETKGDKTNKSPRNAVPNNNEEEIVVEQGKKTTDNKTIDIKKKTTANNRYENMSTTNNHRSTDQPAEDKQTEEQTAKQNENSKHELDTTRERTCSAENEPMDFSVNRKRGASIGDAENNSGRIIGIKIKIEEKEIVLMSIYAPNNNNERVTFFQNLDSVVGDNVVIGGDFNTSLSQKDRHNTIHKPDKPHDKLKELICNKNLYDVWRDRNPYSRHFSWKRVINNQIKMSRIDFFLIDKTLTTHVKNIFYKETTFSDHSFVFLQLDFSTYDRGPGVWIFNNTYLNDDDFCEKITKLVDKEKQCILYQDNMLLWWDNLKYRIKKISQLYEEKDIDEFLKYVNKTLDKTQKEIFISNLLLSRIWYTLTVQPLPEWVEHTLRSSLLEFLWQKKAHPVKYSSIINDKKNGGLNIPDITLKMKSFRLKYMKRYIQAPDDLLWKHTMSYFFRLLGNLNYTKECLFLKYNKRAIDLLPKYYQEMLYAWNDLKQNFEYDLSIEQIYNQPLFYNPEICYKNKCLFFDTFVKAGITKMKDICYEFIPGFLSTRSIIEIISE
ncbi:hypothetical protein ScPMuIL_005230, partial [Solemya velum]